MVTRAQPDRAAARAAAAAVPDPELPMLTIDDLGILRDVAEGDDGAPGRDDHPDLQRLPGDARDRARRAAPPRRGRASPRSPCAPRWPALDHRLDHRRRPPQARRRRHRPAAPGAAPGRAGPADPHRGPAAARACPRCGSPARRRPRSSARPPASRCTAASAAASPSRTSRTSEMAGSRTEFHPLTVARVDPLTDDSAAITFDVPPELAGRFAFAPGQSLTVRRGDERRSYSICAVGARAAHRRPRGGGRRRLRLAGAPGQARRRRRRAGAVRHLHPRPGRPRAARADRRGLRDHADDVDRRVRARRADNSAVTLLYGNRRSDTVMFADEVADLKDAYPARIRLVHVLSREPQEVELFSGRLDAASSARCCPSPSTSPPWTTGGCAARSAWSTTRSSCSPSSACRARRIHRELFWVDDDPPAEATHAETPPRVRAPGDRDARRPRSTTTLPAGTPVLDGAQRVRPDLPFACKGGVCGTCRARVVEGEVTMRRNYALEQDELDAGYILTCQALPASAGRYRRLRRLASQEPQMPRSRLAGRTLSPSSARRPTSCGRCSSSGCAGRCGTPTTNVPHYRDASTRRACTPTTARTWPTWPSSRSPPRPTCATTTRSACSRCRASRSSGCTPRRAPPAGPRSSATPRTTSTSGPR